ncbi:aminotransferase class V-fold PLP-dependent enzyme [candidate division KSB1 bacterium]|nr:aminotransferase class V-fold PLP-dependent enzyme [candidate division KSB1 bacterium]MBL7094410.1 aminotransferase class V-fold PLP-dependent enzyme [candidate division KSB1 bacterium]
MKNIYFTPGPSALYPTVHGHIQEALEKDIFSISHRSEAFKQIYRNTVVSLRSLLNIPNDFFIFFLASATEAMERIIENCAADSSFHFVNGAFSKRFYTIANELKKNPQKVEVEFGNGFNFSNLTIPDKTELIGFTQNETSSGISTPLENIYEIKRHYPEKLVAVDIVSSIPFVDVDYSKIDCTFFSVQKGFGLPAGLGVLVVNRRCLDKSLALKKKNLNIGSYHNFLSIKEQGDKFQTVETPNVLAIYLLGKICEDLIEFGIEKVRKETQLKAGMLYKFFEQHKDFEPFVKEKTFRSQTVIVVNTTVDSEIVINKLRQNGFIVGTGYKEYKNGQIRVANFPSHRIDDVDKLLDCL